MELDGLSAGARLKGLTILGTGDFTHPLWFKELKERLVKDEGAPGFYRLNGKQSPLPHAGSVRFMLTCEVSTIISTQSGVKKVHHLLHLPSLEEAAQVNDLLSKRGNLSADGRPTFGKTSPAELVELLRSASSGIVVVPAHAWTPWFSVFGSKSGFDSVEEGYGDQAKHIFAIESGMSSDPAMNWRISGLDRYSIVSNSDSHSPYPWRLGRECNVFEFVGDAEEENESGKTRKGRFEATGAGSGFSGGGDAEEKRKGSQPGASKRLSFSSFWEAVRKKDKVHFKFTIETPPAYGKYHWDGHRLCGFSCSPAETKKLGGTCPKCGKPLTIGVENRIEELADRPEGFVLEGAVPFRTLLPLHELLSAVYGNALTTNAVAETADRLILAAGSELSVLLGMDEAAVAKLAGQGVASAVARNRSGAIKVAPGFDGEYGRPEL